MQFQAETVKILRNLKKRGETGKKRKKLEETGRNVKKKGKNGEKLEEE